MNGSHVHQHGLLASYCLGCGHHTVGQEVGWRCFYCGGTGNEMPEGCMDCWPSLRGGSGGLPSGVTGAGNPPNHPDMVTISVQDILDRSDLYNRAVIQDYNAPPTPRDLERSVSDSIGEAQRRYMGTLHGDQVAREAEYELPNSVWNQIHGAVRPVALPSKDDPVPGLD